METGHRYCGFICRSHHLAQVTVATGRAKKKFSYVRHGDFLVGDRPGILAGDLGHEQTHFRSSEHPEVGARTSPAYRRSISLSKLSR